ncbi:MAG: AmmeMemoRadiSam system protein B [Terriglobales bacterium]
MDSVRLPAVAGRFYPGARQVLLDEVSSYLSGAEKSQAALGCIAPHAGYMYSGSVAGAVYASLEVPPRCIILCPNHTGRGRPLAIMSQGGWETPLGTVQIDASLANTLKEQFPFLTEDADAHRSEHAIEVQLPFLQQKRAHFTFVPIALGTGHFETLENLGEALAAVLKAQGEPALIVASSDMNHYENDGITRIKDNKAIERILALDPRGLYDVVVKEQISMCGFGPAVVMLTAARHLGATSAKLIKYATSGDVSGDHNVVVGYAGMVVR